MKKVFLAITLSAILLPSVLHAQSVWDRVKQKATDKANSKTDAAADKAIDAADPTTAKPASTAKPPATASTAAPPETIELSWRRSNPRPFRARNKPRERPPC